MFQKGRKQKRTTAAVSRCRAKDAGKEERTHAVTFLTLLVAPSPLPQTTTAPDHRAGGGRLQGRPGVTPPASEAAP